MNIMLLNAGSATLKFRLLRVDEGDIANEAVLAGGLVERWGTPDAAMKVEVTGRPPERRLVAAETPARAAEHAILACRPLGIDAIGHRVVHGGPRYTAPVRITPEVVRGISEVSSLAPLHNGLALAGIEAGLRLLPDTPAVALFDTAFHRTIPDVAASYALPLDLAERHSLRRYGFHGISHRYVSQRLLKCLAREPSGSKLITCHLGNGASVCAVADGKSVDTSMGFTPMEGLVMGTRSGDIDPGLVLYLINVMKMSGTEADYLLNRRSGLLGLSGRSGDARDLEQAAAGGDGKARLALEVFAYRVRKYIGAYAAALGGLDAVAFSGGIGEHSAPMRQRICRGLEHLGALLDPARNASTATDEPAPVHADRAAVQLWVIPTDEERQMAREVFDLLRPHARG